MRTQTFGVELEMTGITRKTAAEVAAAYFGTRSEYIGGSYDKYAAKDSTGRLWCFVSDSSIRVERGRNGEGQQVEMPVLNTGGDKGGKLVCFTLWVFNSGTAITSCSRLFPIRTESPFRKRAIFCSG